MNLTRKTITGSRCRGELIHSGWKAPAIESITSKMKLACIDDIAAIQGQIE